MSTTGDDKMKRKRKRHVGSKTVASGEVEDAEIERIAKLVHAQLGEKLAMEVIRGVAEWHSGGNWRKHVKSLISNVRDQTNDDFRGLIVSGELSPMKLANLQVSAMASVRLKRERCEIERRAILARLTSDQYSLAMGFEAGDGIEPCNKCGSLKTEFVMVPTSTEKDSLQNFSCNSCGHKWRID